MPIRDVQETLTPAARQLLVEIVDDYRAQVLAAAEASASQVGGELREISVHDVLAALKSLQLSGRHPWSNAERILSLYTVTGVWLAAAGLSFFLLQYSAKLDDLRVLLPALLGVSGVILASASFTYRQLRAYRTLSVTGARTSHESGQEGPTEMEFITLWRHIEGEIRRIGAQELGESAASVPLVALTTMLASKHFITVDDAVALRHLLDLRNRILHRGAPTDASELRSAFSAGRTILKKLAHARPEYAT